MEWQPAITPGPLNLKGSFHLALEVGALPRTVASVVLEGLSAEKLQEGAHALCRAEAAQGLLWAGIIAEAPPTLSGPMMELVSRLHCTHEDMGLV